MDLIAINDQVVDMRSAVRKAKLYVTRRLVRRIQQLKKKKGNETQLAQNKRKADNLLEELQILKKVELDNVSKFALLNTKTFATVVRETKPGDDLRGMGRLTEQKAIIRAVNDFRKKFPRWEKELPTLLKMREIRHKYKTKRTTNSKTINQPKQKTVERESNPTLESPSDEEMDEDNGDEGSLSNENEEEAGSLSNENEEGAGSLSNENEENAGSFSNENEEDAGSLSNENEEDAGSFSNDSEDDVGSFSNGSEDDATSANEKDLPTNTKVYVDLPINTKKIYMDLPTNNEDVEDDVKKLNNGGGESVKKLGNETKIQKLTKPATKQKTIKRTGSTGRSGSQQKQEKPINTVNISRIQVIDRIVGEKVIKRFDLTNANLLDKPVDVPFVATSENSLLQPTSSVLLKPKDSFFGNHDGSSASDIEDEWDNAMSSGKIDNEDGGKEDYSKSEVLHQRRKKKPVFQSSNQRGNQRQQKKDTFFTRHSSKPQGSKFGKQSEGPQRNYNNEGFKPRSEIQTKPQKNRKFGNSNSQLNKHHEESSTGNLHPSWEAKRKLKAAAQNITSFQGKKIKFDD